MLKRKLVTSPVLAYPNFKRDFVLETDASIHGIGAVLGQHQDDGNVHPISYGSRALSVAEKNYGITELETLAVVWAISHFHHFLYGHSVTVYADHTAVKAVLESQNPTGKHAWWWNKVYGGGVRAVHIVYRAGKENKNADALSRRPVFPAPQAGIAENELQVAPARAMPPEELNSPPLPCSIQGCDDPALEPTWTSSSDPVTSIRTLYQTRDDNIGTHHCTPIDVSVCPIASHGDGAHTDMHVGQDSAIVDSTLEESSFASEQRKDSSVREIIDFIRHGTLPADNDRARKIALQQSMFTTTDDGILHFIDSKHKNNTRVVVPRHLQQQMLRDTHSSAYGGHFSGQRLYTVLMAHWWWEGMFNDARRFARACPECVIVTGGGRASRPPLHPIPVSKPFQILGIDVMDLPLTDQGNKHVVVIQDLFTKWPLAFAIPDQKTTRIARLVAEEVIPLFVVPECLLSDRGTNLLSNLMMELCKILGIKKLNTTAYHPQCDGAVERFNRTLKTILRKHAAKFGCQWDRFLPGILWAYRNTPHTSTGEKPSFLLFGVDCRSPTEAAYLAATKVHPTDVQDYKEELMLSLSSARQLAASSIQKAQAKYKEQYDRKTKETTFRVGDWILVRFPQDESGRWRKLSRPWHGPYRILDQVRSRRHLHQSLLPSRWACPCSSVTDLSLPRGVSCRLLLVW